MKAIATQDHRTVSHNALLNSIPLSCVDGRQENAVVGSPGGSLGELIVVAAAIESTSGALGKSELRELLERMPSTGIIIYHHTDVKHMATLAGTLKKHDCNGWDNPQAFTEWLMDPPEHCRSLLLELLPRHEHVGCGHLAGMLHVPQKYGVRRDLVEDVIRIFYQMLWDGHPRVQLELLEESHEEQSVLVVPSCGGSSSSGSCKAVIPKSAHSCFVFHPDAAQCVREGMMQLALTVGKTRDGSLDVLNSVANQLAGKQLHATMEQLAPHLDYVHMEPCS